jgi:hypothetical protein
MHYTATLPASTSSAAVVHAHVGAIRVEIRWISDSIILYVFEISNPSIFCLRRPLCKN